MRVYVPVTLAMLQAFVTDGELNAVNGTAFSVTPALREAYAHGDNDELAEVALQEAALGSVRLLSAERLARTSETAPELPTRRGVLVADVDAATPRPDLDDAVVRLSGPVRLDQVVCVHVDNAAAEPAVSAAVDAVDAADLGDEDAELIVGDAQDHDLAWYAPQELPFLLDLL